MSNISEILNIQKNRYPLMFVDKIISSEPGKTIVTTKNFSYNEWYFPIHFEEEPVVPGFVIMESMIQSFILTFLTLKEYKGMKTADSQVKLLRIKRKLIPGDTLIIKSTLESLNRGIAKGRAIGFVNDIEVCSIELEVVILEVFNSFKVEN